MKRALFQLFNVLMACVVLLSSTGFGLVEHTCQMRGKKKTVVVAFSAQTPAKACASDAQAAPTGQTMVKKTDCCDDDLSYDNVETSSSLSQLIAHFVKVVAEAVVTGAVALVRHLLGWLFDQQSALASAFHSPPVALSGRDILTFVQTLLI
ncbi:HYC_CC_PP family protein [Spirosoma rhododendri]|uniref:Uncharacterized protein n=1 Tax=Spirosoma rhododendri TaxID=2728024 RepID=A0A7L5DVW3_9BACT|nr:hypothetical protein [Spirosoma rhododendri]QJD80738.1 hypothetical protein HH216_21690 [Spirosoma rhododendri]